MRIMRRNPSRYSGILPCRWGIKPSLTFDALSFHSFLSLSLSLSLSLDPRIISPPAYFFCFVAVRDRRAANVGVDPSAVFLRPVVGFVETANRPAKDPVRGRVLRRRDVLAIKSLFRLGVHGPSGRALSEPRPGR